jgi:hypothetical protein
VDDELNISEHMSNKALRSVLGMVPDLYLVSELVTWNIKFTIVADRLKVLGGYYLC